MNQQIIDVTEATFTTEIEQAELPVLIDFWAPWCGPCKMIQPILEELARMYQGCIKFTKVNADENRVLTEKYGVRGLPTLLLLKDGKIVERAVGVNPQQGKSRFVELLDKHIAARNLQPARSWQAFHGEAELKRSVIERVRAHIEAGQIQAVESYSAGWPLCDEEAARYSLFGAALHGTGIQAYEAAFGVPASAALLEDAVHNFLVQASTDAEGSVHHFLDESVRGYPLDWLEAIPPGADLNDVTPCFLRWLLLGLASGPLPFDAIGTESAKAALRDVAMLHARLADGDAPSLPEWATVREAAAEACPNYEDDPVSWGLATSAGRFAWPPEDLGLSVRDGLNAVLSGISKAAIRSLYSAEEWAEREAVIAAASTEHEPGKADEASEEMKAARAIRQEIGMRDIAQYEKLKLELGRQWHRGLMQSLEAAIRKGAQ